MSAFNEANEIASQLVWGRHYCDDEPCQKLDEVILVRDNEQKVIPAPPDKSHKTWDNIATFLEGLFYQGWILIEESR